MDSVGKTNNPKTENYMEYTFYFTPNSQNQNFISTMLSKSNVSDSTCFRSVLNPMVFNESLPEMISASLNKCSAYKIVFVVSPDIYEEAQMILKEQLEDSINNNIVINKI